MRLFFKSLVNQYGVCKLVMSVFEAHSRRSYTKYQFCMIEINFLSTINVIIFWQVKVIVWLNNMVWLTYWVGKKFIIYRLFKVGYQIGFLAMLQVPPISCDNYGNSIIWFEIYHKKSKLCLERRVLTVFIQ